MNWPVEWLDQYRKRQIKLHVERSNGITTVTTAEPNVIRAKLPAHMTTPLSKYRNVKTDGEDSKKQAKRLSQLRLMNEAGQIRGLARQVEYILLPNQRDANDKLLERKLTVVIDFEYEEWTGNGWRRVREDTKGLRTKEWIIKRKLLRKIHGIEVIET